MYVSITPIRGFSVGIEYMFDYKVLIVDLGLFCILFDFG